MLEFKLQVLQIMANSAADNTASDLMQLEELIVKHRDSLQRYPSDGQVWALLAMVWYPTT